MRRSQRVRKFISPLQIQPEQVIISAPSPVVPSPLTKRNKKNCNDNTLNDFLSDSSNFGDFTNSPSVPISNPSTPRPDFIRASQFLPNHQSPQLRQQQNEATFPTLDESLRCFGQVTPPCAQLPIETTPQGNPVPGTDFVEVEVSQFTPRVAERFISKFKSGTVQTSQRTGAKYVQRQRSMVNRNEENVMEDDVLFVAQVQECTSQYQRELEEAFDECEKSILNDKNNETNASCFNGISKIIWDEDGDDMMVGINTPSQAKKVIQTQTSHGAVQLAPVSSATFTEMGPFFGLPLKVKKLIKEFKGIDELYDWQKECLRLKTVLQRHNLIYALPTSGGKTLVAEILMLREIICRKKNVLFILPFVSIVQEKLLEISPFAVGLDFLVEEYAAGKGTVPPKKRRTKNSIYVATIEKGLALMDSLIDEKRADEIGLIVVDELHMIGERGRGGTLEILLTKVMLMNCNTQIVGMSATIGNLNEIADWLNADIYSRDFRPVELREYVKVGVDFFEVNQLAVRLDDAFEPVKTLNCNYTPGTLREDPDHLTALVAEEIPLNSVLIFCATKDNCVAVSKLLCKFLPLDLKNHRAQERAELLNAIKRDVGDICPTLKDTIPFGVAYHHSGLTTDERKHIEDAYRLGILCVICCTSTLAAGVNLPAKRVILRSPYVGREFITLSKYKQMAGRAGRAGKTASNCGESILICSKLEFERVCNLLFSPMDEANSSLAILETSGLESFILSAIDLGLANTRDALQKLVTKTLLYIQSQRLGVDVKWLVDGILRDLYKGNAISIVNDSNLLKPKNLSVLIESQSSINESGSAMITSSCNGTDKPKIKIKGKTELQVSRLGKAAIKACITLSRAEMLFHDLQEAQRHLVLTDYLHLLYLATPYDQAENITPDAHVYYNAYSELGDSEAKTARVIGLTEVRARGVLGRKNYDAETTRKLKRFFVTLILYDLWQGRNVNDVDRKFKVGRGTVQMLMTHAATTASIVFRFCEQLDEFWSFKQLFEVMTKRLQHCCSMELMPLMDLPAVKLARAKQLYAAGFKRLEDIVGAAPSELVRKIENMSNKVARQLIAAAKALLLEKVEDLRGEMQEVMMNLK